MHPRPISTFALLLTGCFVDVPDPTALNRTYACDGPDHCLNGHRCVAHVCVPEQCDSAEQCPSGFSCADHQCQPAPDCKTAGCLGDAVCVAHQDGAGGMCVPGCSRGGDRCANDGWCLQVKGYRDEVERSLLACVGCPDAPCPRELEQDCVLGRRQSEITYFDQAEARCACTNDLCGQRGASFRCVNDLCTDECGPHADDCPNDTQCIAGRCAGGAACDPADLCADIVCGVAEQPGCPMVLCDTCSNGARCVLRQPDAGADSYACERTCPALSGPCNDLNGSSGTCVEVRKVNGDPILVCAGCPACGVGQVCRARQPAASSIEEVGVSCVCDEMRCQTDRPGSTCNEDGVCAECLTNADCGPGVLCGEDRVCRERPRCEAFPEACALVVAGERSDCTRCDESSVCVQYRRVEGNEEYRCVPTCEHDPACTSPGSQGQCVQAVGLNGPDVICIPCEPRCDATAGLTCEVPPDANNSSIEDLRQRARCVCDGATCNNLGGTCSTDGSRCEASSGECAINEFVTLDLGTQQFRWERTIAGGEGVSRYCDAIGKEHVIRIEFQVSGVYHFEILPIGRTIKVARFADTCRGEPQECLHGDANQSLAWNIQTSPGNIFILVLDNDDSMAPLSYQLQVRPLALCGNGIIEPPETCEDGNTLDGDGCSATCAFERVCGNGRLDVGEACDTAAPPPNVQCHDDCTRLDCMRDANGQLLYRNCLGQLEDGCECRIVARMDSITSMLVADLGRGLRTYWATLDGTSVMSNSVLGPAGGELYYTTDHGYVRDLANAGALLYVLIQSGADSSVTRLDGDPPYPSSVTVQGQGVHAIAADNHGDLYLAQEDGSILRWSNPDGPLEVIERRGVQPDRLAAGRNWIVWSEGAQNGQQLFFRNSAGVTSLMSNSATLFSGLAADAEGMLFAEYSSGDVRYCPFDGSVIACDPGFLLTTARISTNVETDVALDGADLLYLTRPPHDSPGLHRAARATPSASTLLAIPVNVGYPAHLSVSGGGVAWAEFGEILSRPVCGPEWDPTQSTITVSTQGQPNRFASTCGDMSNAPDVSLVWTAPQHGYYLFAITHQDYNAVFQINYGACGESRETCGNISPNTQDIAACAGSIHTLIVDGLADQAGTATLAVTWALWDPEPWQCD